MAYENIDISHPNFCIGPKAGTFCYVDTSGANAVMRVRNSSGDPVAPSSVDFYPTNILDLDSDSYPKNVIKALKYFGPTGQSDVFDNLPFYTLERYTDSSGNSSQFTIRRWLRDSTNNRLTLDRTITKSSSGNYQYDVYAIAIESNLTEFASATDSGTGYIVVDSVDGIEVGSEIMLGPGTDNAPISNLNAVEFVTVSGINGTTIYLNDETGYTPPYYQYQSGDPITINGDIFTFSDKSYGNDSSKGAVYRFSHDGSFVEYDNQGTYYGVRAADWCEAYNNPALINTTNMIVLDINTLSSLGWYKPYRSMSLTNVETDGNTEIPIYDLEFDSTDVYKLQKKVTKWNDSGQSSTYSWTNYNYVLDTFSQYSANVAIVPYPNGVLSQDDTVTLRAVVRNQFGVGLSSKNVQFYASGDSAAYFTPLNGQAITDSNGIAEVEYTSGGYAVFGGEYQGFNGMADVSVRADGGYTGNGTAYVWDGIYLQTYGSYESSGDTFLHQLPTLSGGTPDITWPLYTERMITQVSGLEAQSSLINRTKFSFPGGHWRFNGSIDVMPTDSTKILRQVLYPTANVKNEGTTSVPVDIYIDQFHAMYQRNNPKDGADAYRPEVYITQDELATNDLQLGQVYVSRHVLTGHQDTTELDQYVFVEDAIPAFWSYKNPTTTDIWIRLLPFADSLNASSLIFKIREVSYVGDTGFYDITSAGSTSTFDAGGGLLGVEFQWYNPGAFHHNAMIYVYVEIDDVAGNTIVVEYWFKIIPDFKAPYLENLNPAREEVDVDPATNVSFDIKDAGTGIDINSFMMFVNGRRVTPDITKVFDTHYQVSYNSSKDFIYGETVEISVRVDDSSEQSNTLLDSWRFYIDGSEGPWFDVDSFTPRPCSEGVLRKNTGVSFNVYEIDDTGLDRSSVLVSIGGKYRDVTITPILYRIK